MVCVIDIVIFGVGDLDVGGVVDLIREVVCILVSGFCKLILGCLIMGRVVRDLGSVNVEVVVIVFEIINNIFILFLIEIDSNC